MLTVLERRYLLKDERRRIVETPDRMSRRVATAIARGDSSFGAPADMAASSEEFYGIVSRLEFLPNSPTLMNAGAPLGQLMAYFVLPIENNLDSIFGTLRDAAYIQQSGGGTGFSFSRLRPQGDVVMATKGVASGPVSFMMIYGMATEVMKQGGTRRGSYSDELIEAIAERGSVQGLGRVPEFTQRRNSWLDRGCGVSTSSEGGA